MSDTELDEEAEEEWEDEEEMEEEYEEEEEDETEDLDLKKPWKNDKKTTGRKGKKVSSSEEEMVQGGGKLGRVDLKIKGSAPIDDIPEQKFGKKIPAANAALANFEPADAIKEITKQRNEQQVRKQLMRDVCLKYHFDAKAIRQIYGLALEMQLPNKIEFKQFLRMLNVDETPHLRSLFVGIAGTINGFVNLRLLLMMLMNSLQNPPSKDERLKWAFGILDEHEDRMIPYEDFLLILQANYFAGSPSDVDSKGKLLLKETSNSKSAEDPIQLEDYQRLCVKFQSLFFPNEVAMGGGGAQQNSAAAKMLGMF
ncbi:hypothetical protein FGO68_gene11394 [Halteria grandinella]|uniref:EF-hand domain-containing protein n=1 Tax=Halteria grandinella TaxID=5974 RepID=A0A8J8T9A0_HALGN|nr:hypothetical protein FGO68_gene11394 [Halteria grandinella]